MQEACQGDSVIPLGLLFALWLQSHFPGLVMFRGHISSSPLGTSIMRISPGKEMRAWAMS